MVGRLPPRPKPEPQARKTTAQDPLVTEAEARRQLGDISVRQLANMRSNREIAYVRMNSGCRYPQSAIDAWVQSRMVKAEPNR